jgi:UDP-GlcNAc3NAcA epimerase
MKSDVVTLITIVGTRPQFIKAAAVSRAIARHNQKATAGTQLRETIVHTGQHYDVNMSAVFFEELAIPEPRYHLGVGSGTHGRQTGAMLERLEKVLLEERPAWVLVYGDTNSALAGALAAVKLHVPVAHVEAGLRSFNRRMPEEINRTVADRVSELLFSPTRTAVENLAREGITRGVHNVGDVMYDSVLFCADRATERSRILITLGLAPKSYFLATVHRAENTEDRERLRAIFKGLGAIEAPVVLPLHPRTAKALQAEGVEIAPNIRLIEPLAYLDVLMLEQHARAILTDSGGMQKEACFFKVPCVTLRDETEWVELVEAGVNFLTGADPERIMLGVHWARDWKPRPPVGPLYGDGKAAESIVRILATGSA